jgi:hypothetical protein
MTKTTPILLTITTTQAKLFEKYSSHSQLTANLTIRAKGANSTRNLNIMNPYFAETTATVQPAPSKDVKLSVTDYQSKKLEAMSGHTRISARLYVRVDAHGDGGFELPVVISNPHFDKAKEVVGNPALVRSNPTQSPRKSLTIPVQAKTTSAGSRDPHLPCPALGLCWVKGLKGQLEPQLPWVPRSPLPSVSQKFQQRSQPRPPWPGTESTRARPRRPPSE